MSLSKHSATPRERCGFHLNSLVLLLASTSSRVLSRINLPFVSFLHGGGVSLLDIAYWLECANAAIWVQKNLLLRSGGVMSGFEGDGLWLDRGRLHFYRLSS
jgi:hypothetical protein